MKKYVFAESERNHAIENAEVIHVVGDDKIEKGAKKAEKTPG